MQAEFSQKGSLNYFPLILNILERKKVVSFSSFDGINQGIKFFYYLFLTALGLHCCVQGFSLGRVQASHCNGVSCYRGQALEYMGISSCDTQAQ